MPSILTFPCNDCAANTIDTGDYYMVKDAVWEEAGMSTAVTWDADDEDMVAEFGPPPPHQFLCIRCLEKRIGRRLSRADFTDVPLNDPNFGFPKNNRLLAALQR